MREILIEKYECPTTIIEEWNGITYEWRDSSGELHRNNGLPAYVMIDNDGITRNRRWCKNGLTHRKYGLPAIIEYEIDYNIIDRFLNDENVKCSFSGKKQFWFVNGKNFRPNGKPTEEDGDGTKIWHNEKGEYHRIGGGPAVIRGNGTLEWWRNGKLFRWGDKPVVIHPTGACDFVDRYGVKEHVNISNALTHYGEQIKKDREKNGVFRTYVK